MWLQIVRSMIVALCFLLITALRRWLGQDRPSARGRVEVSEGKLPTIPGVSKNWPRISSRVCEKDVYRLYIV